MLGRYFGYLAGVYGHIPGSRSLSVIKNLVYYRVGMLFSVIGISPRVGEDI
jgi:hypothetical protein